MKNSGFRWIGICIMAFSLGACGGGGGSGGGSSGGNAPNGGSGSGLDSNPTPSPGTGGSPPPSDAGGTPPSSDSGGSTPPAGGSGGSTGSPANPPPSAFTASVTHAPADGTTISGTVRILVEGSAIENVELIPSSEYSPLYARGVVAGNKEAAYIDFNSEVLPDGPISVRVATFNVPPGEGGSEVIAMSVRTWNIKNTFDPVEDSFEATVVDAPPDGATIRGRLVFFQIAGNSISNAELLPPTGYAPKYLAGFSHGKSGPGKSLSAFWDTTTLPNGPVSVRIAAFDRPAGDPMAREITAMTVRNYVIDNSAPSDFTAQLVTAPQTNAETFWLGSQPGGGSISPTVYFEVSGTELGNVELVSAKDPSIIYGRFTVSPHKTRATLDWDYRSYNEFSYGVYEVRVLAWDVPPGENGQMIEVMEPRTYHQKLPLWCQGAGLCGGVAP